MIWIQHSRHLPFTPQGSLHWGLLPNMDLNCSPSSHNPPHLLPKLWLWGLHPLYQGFLTFLCQAPLCSQPPLYTLPPGQPDCSHNTICISYFCIKLKSYYWPTRQHNPAPKCSAGSCHVTLAGRTILHTHTHTHNFQNRGLQFCPAVQIPAPE